MSVSEFSAALKNKALKEWFVKEKAGGGSASSAAQAKYRAENVNILANPVGDYRSAEQTSEKTSFIITKDTIKDLLGQFHNITDQVELDELSNVYFNAFNAKNAGVVVSRKKITVGEGIPAVYFPNISFKSITDLVNNILNIKSGELAKYYEKGHVVGLTTELLQVTSNRIKAVDTSGSTGKAFLLAQLDKVIAYYKRLDLDSANIQPAKDVKVYASVNKRVNKDGSTRYLVELQPKDANQKSAKEVQATLGTVRKLFSPGNLSEKAIIDLISKLQDSVSDPKFQQDLLDMKSSPSYKDMVAKLIVDSIAGTPATQAYVHKDIFIASNSVPKPDLSKLRAEAKRVIAEAERTKKLLQRTANNTIRLQGKFYSLAGLQTLINNSLSKQIQKNMGTGNSRNVLNYRTGRLAESAEVQRLTLSREGMISAYYSYMKDPYATFSQGGQQSVPQSRDPKLLISKSIREIAATQVSNRLRAVLV